MATGYAWNSPESLPSVDAILVFLVKYAMSLDAYKGTSTTSNSTYANLVRDAMLTTLCSQERNVLAALHWTTCVFQSKSANQDNL